jgi:hypothetical protein
VQPSFLTPEGSFFQCYSPPLVSRLRRCGGAIALPGTRGHAGVCPGLEKIEDEPLYEPLSFQHGEPTNEPLEAAAPPPCPVLRRTARTAGRSWPPCSTPAGMDRQRLEAGCPSGGESRAREAAPGGASRS